MHAVLGANRQEVNHHLIAEAFLFTSLSLMIALLLAPVLRSISGEWFDDTLLQDLFANLNVAVTLIVLVISTFFLLSVFYKLAGSFSVLVLHHCRHHSNQGTVN